MFPSGYMSWLRLRCVRGAPSNNENENVEICLLAELSSLPIFIWTYISLCGRTSENLIRYDSHL